MIDLIRCDWSVSDPLLIDYHDHEWGVPQTDDRILFEFLTLESAQAGLSWLTILRKRDGYRSAFARFDIEVVSQFGEERIAQLLRTPEIVRNNQKVRSTIANAVAIVQLYDEGKSLSEYLWDFVGDQTINNGWKVATNIPNFTDEAVAMSNGLKARGFRFIGPTICYALMQACGLVNDHLTECFRHGELLER